MANYSVYSLADVVVTFKCKVTGKTTLTEKLSEKGSGRITISYGGELATNTKTATGFVVINKMVAHDGTVGLEIPQNSAADEILRKWINYCKACSTSEFANATMTVSDPAGKQKFTLYGVVPQRLPDESYDQQSGNRQYQLLYADMKWEKTK